MEAMVDSAVRSAGSSSRVPWYLALAVVAVFFVSSVVMAYRSVSIMADNNQREGDTLHVISLIHQLRSQFYAVESGQRGFLVTQNPAYLAPYEQGWNKVHDLLGLLRTGTLYDSEQHARFQKMYPVALERLEEMRESVSLVRRKYDDTALALIDTDRGIRLMSTVMDYLDEMERDEYAVLDMKRAEAHQRRGQLLTIIITANTIGLLLTFATFFFAYRHALRVTELNKKIEQANSELESKVELRTQVLAQYAEELKRSNRELEDFAFVASHDLQEPLRKIRAFGDRLLKTYSSELGDKGADYINRMHSASERMSVLINDILSFSRVTSRQKPFEKVDLNKLLEGVLDDLDYAIRDSDATIERDPMPEIDADASQLAQVFSNLIGNSIKFRLPDRPPAIRIQLATPEPAEIPLGDTNREWIKLILSDNGIGFDPQYKDRVFNIFQRLHGQDEYKGTGIGLALCRKIVERHAGSISADSRPGEGAIFSIVLPTTQLTLDDTTIE